ncbi:MAG: AtpZ/AtpI family protein [Elusimicrobiaceae bacterium]
MNRKNSAFDYLQIGLQLAITALAGLFAGYWLDKKLDTRPWLTLTFSILGSAAGLYSAIRQALKTDERK